jgi:SAM-dependent methyltransferase
MTEYLMAGQQSELERLRLQAEMWEPAGRDLLAKLGPGEGRRVVDIGCGALGWLRVLSEWVGPSGQVIGTDIDDTLLDAARTLVEDEGLTNVTLRRDDLFASTLEPGSFDLVHARFVIAPVGRGAEQLAVYRKLAAPGALLVLEEPDTGSWHFNPPAPAAERLIDLTRQAFTSVGSDLDAGRSVPALLATNGLQPNLHSAVLAVPAGHPFLRLPIQFTVSLEPRFAGIIPLDELRELRATAEAELAEPGRWGTSFTLIQTWARC